MEMGELTLAAQWLESAEAWALHLKTDTWCGPIQVAWARFHQLEGNLERAYAAVQMAFANPVAREQALWQLSGHRIAGELAVALGDRRAAEQHLLESVAMAEQCQVPYEAALSHLALGSLLPDLPGARERVMTAREALARLGATPALRRAESALAGFDGQARPADDRLTDREREIVRLVAQGHTDKDIAAQLFISPRTVDRHLRNVFVKLNISSRSALGVYAVRAGLLG